ADPDHVAVCEQVLPGRPVIDGEGQPQGGQPMATLDGGEDQATVAEGRIVNPKLMARTATEAGDGTHQGGLDGGLGAGGMEEEAGHAELSLRGAGTGALEMQGEAGVASTGSWLEVKARALGRGRLRER